MVVVCCLRIFAPNHTTPAAAVFATSHGVIHPILPPCLCAPSLELTFVVCSSSVVGASFVTVLALFVVGLAVAAATTCPDGSSCSSDATCCPTATGGYGCCPSAGATCCSDHEHCCPKEYPVCDVAQGLCKKSGADVFGISMMKKEEATPASTTTVPDLFDAELIDIVNKDESSTWTAGVNDFFRGWTFEELRQYMGAETDDMAKLPKGPQYAADSAPASFDARTKWPSCVGPVMNQARCGSCWAFGAAESISDRMCITGKSQGYVQLAPLDLTTCDTMCSGCQGGAPSMAWMYAQYNGLVTNECYPYLQSNGGPIPTCAPKDQPCLNFVNTPTCANSCTNSSLNWQNSKHKISGYYGVPGESAMMTELSTNGPFEVTMTVYSDFVHYKSGVYQHKTGQMLGGHAIKVIGYGTEDGMPYWLIQNSWTTTWGDGGYFKILRGSDECGIEDGGVAGTM